MQSDAVHTACAFFQNADLHIPKPSGQMFVCGPSTTEKTANDGSVDANYMNLTGLVADPDNQSLAEPKPIDNRRRPEIQHSDSTENLDISAARASDSVSAPRVETSSSPGKNYVKLTMQLVSLTEPLTNDLWIHDGQTEPKTAENCKDSSYLSLPESRRHRQASDAISTEIKTEKVAEGKLTADRDSKRRVCRAEKHRSADEPTQLRKPDLCILGQDVCEWTSNARLAAPSSGLRPPQLPHSSEGQTDVVQPAAPPQKLKPPVLHKKPQFLPLSKKTARATYSGRTPDLDEIQSRGSLEAIAACSPPVLGTLESPRRRKPSSSSSENRSTLEAPEAASLHPGAHSFGMSRCSRADIRRTNVDEKEEKKSQTMMRSSLAEAQDEDDRAEKDGTKIITAPSITGRKMTPRKRRKKRAGRQLLMMSSRMESSPSSSSSSSSSSLSSSSSDEEREAAESRETSRNFRPPHSRVYFEETSDSDGSGATTGQSRHSLSSVLSSDSLQVALSLPDLRIQEPGEGADRSQEEEQANAPLDGKT